MISVGTAARGNGAMGRQIGKRQQAFGRFIADLEACKIPKCESCGAANPKNERACPNCGIAHRGISEIQLVKAVFAGENLVPWHARAMLWIGRTLRQFSDRIERP